MSSGLKAFLFALLIVPVVSFSATSPVFAAEKEKKADESGLSKEALKNSEAFIDKLGTKALGSLVGSGITKEERAKRFRSLLNEHFDVATIGRFALGRYWRVATDAEKQEYMKLFEKMIVDVYSNRFEEYSGQTLKVTGNVPVGKNDIIVKSDLVQPEGSKGGTPVTLEWRVRYKDGQYKIIDVIVAGVSMSVTQRSDFASVIEKGGGKIEALLTSLKERKPSSGKGKESEKADKEKSEAKKPADKAS